LTETPAFPEHWNIAAARLISDRFSSRVRKVAPGDGWSAVVRNLKPFDDIEDGLRGVHLPGWRNDHGLVPLSRQSRDRMLIE